MQAILSAVHTPLGWFWLLWVVATVVGGFIGTYASVKGQEVGTQIVGEVIGGTIMGFAQWGSLGISMLEQKYLTNLQGFQPSGKSQNV